MYCSAIILPSIRCLSAFFFLFFFLLLFANSLYCENGVLMPVPISLGKTERGTRICRLFSAPKPIFIISYVIAHVFMRQLILQFHMQLYDDVLSRLTIMFCWIVAGFYAFRFHQILLLHRCGVDEQLQMYGSVKKWKKIVIFSLFMIWSYFNCQWNKIDVIEETMSKSTNFITISVCEILGNESFHGRTQNNIKGPRSKTLSKTIVLNQKKAAKLNCIVL